MTTTESETIARIERDRRRREDELLLLLLLLIGRALRHAQVAVVHGLPTSNVINNLINGDIALGHAGVAPVIARSMADAYADAIRRVRRLSGLSREPIELDPLIQRFAPKAMLVADALSTRLRQITLESTTPRELRDAFEAAGYTRSNEFGIDLLTERAIVSSYNQGIIDGAADTGIATGLQHVSVLDERTTEICTERDGLMLPVDDPYWKNGGTPPLHFNALPSGSNITAAAGKLEIERVRVGDLVLTHRGRFRRVYKTMGRKHNTKIVVLRLSSGGILRITDEHPVLTTVGWKRAGELRAGHEIFENFKQPSGLKFLAAPPRIAEQMILIHAHNSPSQFDEPFISHEVFAMSASVASAVQFQNDGMGRKGEVCYIPLNRKLADKANRFADNRSHHLFASRQFASVSLRNCFGSDSHAGFVQRWVGCAQHSRSMNAREGSGLIGHFSPPVIVSGEHSSSVQFIDADCGSVDSCSHSDSVSFAPATNDCFSDTDLPLNGANGFHILKMLDRNKTFDAPPVSEIHHGWKYTTITSIADEKFDGFVWNLAVEEDETYCAEEIVVHNCRSILIPIFHDFTPSDWRPITPPMPGFGAA